MLAFLTRRSARDPAQEIARFLGRPEHAWIVRDRALLRSLAGFFALLPYEDIPLLLERSGLLLLYCNQKMSAAFYQFERREIVLVFPELRRLLTSAHFRQGWAVLAHELGHVRFGHSRRKVNALDAQLEADRYAQGMELGPELVAVLRELENCNEARTRIVALS